MTQEDKELLLKDLAARLPYGVMLNIDYYDLQGDGKLKNRDVILSYGNIGYCSDNTNWVSVKPYLRSMSNMTEEEYKELKSISPYYGFAPYEYIGDWCPNYEMVDWCNKNHFDYRGLIGKGLAIAVTEERNPYK